MHHIIDHFWSIHVSALLKIKNNFNYDSSSCAPSSRAQNDKLRIHSDMWFIELLLIVLKNIKVILKSWYWFKLTYMTQAIDNCQFNLPSAPRADAHTHHD